MVGAATESMRPKNVCVLCSTGAAEGACHGLAEPVRIVLTGGPCAGKTAVLEVVRHHFCEHVAVLPESASILFRGGFPREPERESRKAVQVAIFHVQTQLERIALAAPNVSVALCDRGAIDGLAYWPDTDASFWKETGATREEAYARYRTVIHLRTPREPRAYTHGNPVRTETHAEALEIDERIESVWAGHPHRITIESTRRFLDKVERVLAALRDELPDCCAQRISERVLRHELAAK